MATNLEHTCPDCFCETYENHRCTNCGYKPEDETRENACLPHFTVLEERYLLGRVLGAGGFGITYKAWDFRTNTLCAIKEYYPIGCAVRAEGNQRIFPKSSDQQEEYDYGKKQFLEEARLLHEIAWVKGIVNAYADFEENNTAYYVMEYIDGINLKAYCNQHGNRIPIREAIGFIIEAGKILQTLHTQCGIIHRDVSPENIMISVNGTVKLIDFGCARKRNVSLKYEKTISLKPGFAPPEQYVATIPQGSYTDVYALASTFYYMVVGHKIPDAKERQAGQSYQILHEYSNEIPKDISEAVDQALHLDYRLRIQTVHNFMQILSRYHIPQWRVPVLAPEAQRKIRAKYKGQLEVVKGDMEGAMWTFGLDVPIKIGRSKIMANISISEDVAISKVHFELAYNHSNKRFKVTDLSSNGMIVAGLRLQKNVPYYISPGTILTLGNGICEIRLGVTHE